MECAHCHRDREQGQAYGFYFARKTGKSERFDVQQLARIRSTYYHIAGHERAWICDRCANDSYRATVRFSILFAFLGLLIALGVGSAGPAAERAQTILGGLACCVVPFLPLALVFRALRERWRVRTGERYALLSRKAALQQQGYDAFFTTEEYNGLQRPG